MEQNNKFILGVEELNEIADKIDLGYVILIAGNPGTGKTIGASKILYENMTKLGIKTIYVSFVETKSEYYKNLKRLGLDMEELEKKGLFTYLEEITFLNKDLIPDILNQILNTVEQTGAKIIVIDSISPLLQVTENIISLREILHNFFYRLSKIKGITTILIQEVPYGNENIGFGVEEFLVDAVIFLKTVQIKGRSIRIMEIKKARGSDVSLVSIPFIIRKDKGISVLYPKNVKEKRSNKLINVVVGNNSFTVSLGSQNLIIANPKIDIQALASLIIVGAVAGTPNLSENIRRKTIIRMMSYTAEEFSSQIKNCLLNAGIDKNKVDELLKSYIIDGIDVNKYSLTEYFDHVKEIEEMEKPAFVLNIGLDAIIQLLADNEIYPRLELDAMIRRINNNITTLYLMNGNIKDYYSIPLGEEYDNVWYFYPYKENRLIIKPFRLKMKIFASEKYTINLSSIKCLSRII
ncbi:MAG: RAD55 family ATPase [Caldisphaera sp.]|uniref:RAD55 family ATPase n=1 Tax=Caldisphaera sp. TaxID=2060322 RepID=UPI003D1479EF